ncbi:MAG TPA: (2Fe-2S)-binding protein [Ktedonobacteraceae bacterium]|nr:(2Fe-2S)-binding protein [Ktedonobacteraceae bacterium]
MPALEIALKVNGRSVQWSVHPGETLLEALHAHYLKGTKLICGTGDCCGCGVILNGRSINACCTLAAQADGAEVLTIEGLSADGKLHPIQEAFAEEGAAQCGYCTPGFIMRAYAFLQEHPHPTENDVRAALAGNICRCTGYVKPVAAVLRAAEMMSDETRAGASPTPS